MGVSIVMGVSPKMEALFHGTSQSKMDDKNIGLPPKKAHQMGIYCHGLIAGRSSKTFSPRKHGGLFYGQNWG